MNVLVTGSSKGTGKAICEKFLDKGHNVIGFDILKESINHKNYTHYNLDVSEDELPELDNVNIVIPNHATNDENLCLKVNLEGYIRIAEKYCWENKNIKSVLFIGSQSGFNGIDFPRYSASKAGCFPLMKYTSRRISKFGACANSISPGPVLTELNLHILQDKKLYDEVANQNILHKWIDCSELADWVYFITMKNKSATGADFLIDCGENNNYNFIC